LSSLFDVSIFSISVKTPIINTRKMKDRTIKQGEKIDLNCRLKGRTFPVPVFQWLKDGVEISLVNPKADVRTSK